MNKSERRTKSAAISPHPVFYKMYHSIYVNENTFCMHAVRHIRITAVLCKFVYTARAYGNHYSHTSSLLPSKNEFVLCQGDSYSIKCHINEPLGENMYQYVSGTAFSHSLNLRALVRHPCVLIMPYADAKNTIFFSPRSRDRVHRVDGKSLVYTRRS